MEEEDKYIENEDVTLNEDEEATPQAADSTELTANVEDPDSTTPKVDNLLEAVADIFPDFDLNKENLNGWIVKSLTEYRNADARIDEVLSLNPEFAAILQKVYNGEDAITAMTSVITPEEYADMVENGGIKSREARDGRIKRIKEVHDWEQARDANLQVSIETTRQFQEETGKSDNEIKAIIDTLYEINDALSDGKVTKRELALIDKLLNADANVQTAAEAAAVAERNKQIEAKKTTDFKPSGDGLPPIASGGSVPESNPLKDSLFGGHRKSVWD
jgi:hypothetical protein